MARVWLCGAGICIGLIMLAQHFGAFEQSAGGVVGGDDLVTISVAQHNSSLICTQYGLKYAPMCCHKTLYVVCG